MDVEPRPMRSMTPAESSPAAVGADADRLDVSGAQRAVPAPLPLHDREAARERLVEESRRPQERHRSERRRVHGPELGHPLMPPRGPQAVGRARMVTCPRP